MFMCWCCPTSKSGLFRLAQCSLNSIFQSSQYSPHLPRSGFVRAALPPPCRLRYLSSVSFRLLLCMLSDSSIDSLALRVWWAGRRRWNNNHSACLYRAVSQLVPGALSGKPNAKQSFRTTRPGREHRGCGGSFVWENRCLTDVASEWQERCVERRGRLSSARQTRKRCFRQLGERHAETRGDTRRPSQGTDENPAGWLLCLRTYSDNTPTYFW